MEKFALKNEYSLHDLVELVTVLRDPVHGCPWDKEQTHESIRQNFIEEVYEAAEAIDRGSRDMLVEELGDVLLQVMLHAEIDRQSGGFNIDTVSDGICKKLILRHPHIFGDTAVDGSGEVLRNWEDIKRTEKDQNSGSDAIDDVPRAMPALMRSQKIQKRAAYVGFDYDDIGGAIADLESEVAELKQAVLEGSNIAEELGDIIFAAVNVARFAKADAELCTERAADKFAQRFRIVEELANQQGTDMKTAGISRLDKLWEDAKKRTGLNNQ